MLQILYATDCLVFWLDNLERSARRKFVAPDASVWATCMIRQAKGVTLTLSPVFHPETVCEFLLRIAQAFASDPYSV